jgi:hypothetical protein
LIRRLALNLLRRDSQAKDSLRRKLRAMLNDNYRSRLLFSDMGT